MLQALRKRVDEDQQGFTLIELLVVVIIIGILAAIAIPVFLNQRERAWQRAAESDMRNAAVVMEEVFSDDGNYAAAAGEYTRENNTVTTADPDPNTYTLVVSDDVTLTVASQAVDGGTDNGYTITGTHENLGGNAVLDSTDGVVTSAWE